MNKLIIIGLYLTISTNFTILCSQIIYTIPKSSIPNIQKLIKPRLQKASAHLQAAKPTMENLMSYWRSYFHPTIKEMRISGVKYGIEESHNRENPYPIDYSYEWHRFYQSSKSHSEKEIQRFNSIIKNLESE